MNGSLTSPDKLESKSSQSHSDEMASDQSAAPNPFARFAYRPQHPEPTSLEDRERPLLSTAPSQKSLGKRKATNPEDVLNVDSNSMHLVSQWTKKKRLSNTNSKASPGSKKVKIYENLRELDDYLDSGLDIIICGINPSAKSSQLGHHYGNPTNHFWSCLYQSGLTSRLLDPREDSTLPQDFSIGLTNLVGRPTVEQSELSKAEQISGVPELMKKLSQHRPRITCFVGLGIADIVKSVLVGKSLKSKTAVGLQPYKLIYPNGNPRETLFYAVSSTSGRVVRYQKTEKIQQFTDLRLFVEKMRKGGLDTEGLIGISVESSGTASLIPDV